MVNVYLKLNYRDMDITINILEVASELAHSVVCEQFNYDSVNIYESVTDAVTNYTDEAQELFNEWYDYYYDFLLDLSIKDEQSIQ